MPERRQRTWDATTGTEIKVLRGHDDWVGSAAFSPDGTRSSPPRATARRGFGTRWLGRSQRASRPRNSFAKKEMLYDRRQGPQARDFRAVPGDSREGRRPPGSGEFLDAEREQRDRRSLRLSPGGQDGRWRRRESRLALGDPGSRRDRLPRLGGAPHILSKTQSRQVRSPDAARSGPAGAAVHPRTRNLSTRETKIAVAD